MLKKEFYIFLVLGCTLSFAQNDSIKPIKLEAITLKVARIKGAELQLPLSLSHVDFNKRQIFHQQISLNEYLTQIPGLFAMNANNFSQDLRVSIRGFGARSAFGIRGIKILVDGIPETTPDGQGQIDNLSLPIIENIEVIRGPASSLYGNASGGVISISTIEKLGKSFINAGISTGNYGMLSTQATMGVKTQRANYIFHANRVISDGYRDQSAFKNSNFNLRMLRHLSGQTLLNFQANYTKSPIAQDAGGLTIEEVKEDRRQARQRNVDFKTKETVDQLKFGLALEHRINNITLESSNFYSSRNFKGYLPFEFGGIVNLDRHYFGHGTSLTYNGKAEQHKNKFQFGYEFAFQMDARERFRSLEGVQGENTLDQEESFQSFGLFGLYHLHLKNLLIIAGLRYDSNLLKVKDLFLSDGDDYGRQNLNSLNPSLSINYKLKTDNYLYLSFSTSFETPTLSELSSNPNGQGGFNEALKAQKAKNYELGYKIESKRSRASIALFYIRTSYDLVPYELENFPGRTFYRNAGSTDRKGIEFSYYQTLNEQMSFNLNYTISDFNYDSYSTAAGSYDGKVLPGIPDHFGALTMFYKNKPGLMIKFQTQLIGALFANDANTVKTKAYTLSNLNLAYKIKFKSFQFSPFLGINNLFDTKYYDNVRLNAFGSRYYEPAPGINFFGGLKFNF